MADQPVGSRPAAQAAVCCMLVLLGCAGWSGLSRAQDSGYATGGQPGIYVCVDARGRHLMADRPIPECIGTGQRELRPGGELKRIIPPVLTASEQAREATRLEQEADLQTQLKEDRRRDRALVLRYPDPAAHARARAEWLAQQDGLIAAMRMREAELRQQGLGITARLELYRQQHGLAPAGLRQLEQENARLRALQSAQLAAQLRERERLEQRFDEELARLRQLWAPPLP